MGWTEKTTTSSAVSKWLFGAVLMLLLFVVGIYVAGHGALAGALDALRASGEPMSIDDLPAPATTEGLDPVAWFDSLRALESEAEQLALTEELRQLAPFDHRAVMRGHLPGGKPLKALSIVRVAELLHGAGSQDLLDGDGASALRRIDLLLTEAELVEGVPTILYHAVWLGVVRHALELIQEFCSLADPGLPALGYLDRLAALEPAAALRSSLLGERLLMMELVDKHLLEDPVAGFFHRFNAATHLRCLEDALVWTGKPAWENELERAAWREAYDPPPFYAPLAAGISTGIERQYEPTIESEAGLALARVALITYLRGTDAGVIEGESTTDPFDGTTLENRVTSDGTLMLWSVGANRIDDGGVAGEDIVWTVRPKK